jgi:sugar/nucleoside kinase (ribokinase family)
MEWITSIEAEVCRVLGVTEKEILKSALPEATEQLSRLRARNIGIKLGRRGCYLGLADGWRELVRAFRRGAVSYEF